MSASERETKREVPALLVEQLALGELDEARAARVRGELGSEDALARIDASNREILADYPPERVAADIRRRLELADNSARAPGRAWIPWVLAPTMVAAAALVWVMAADDESSKVATRVEVIDNDESETTRIKGGVEPHLVIDRHTAAGNERLVPDQVVASGDLLQVSYVPAGRRHGVIISIDGAGAVTLQHPQSAGASPTLVDGTEVPLAHSYELDEAPGFERFVFVTRDGQQPRVDEVMRAAERLASDPAKARSAPLELAGGGWQQHSLMLRKAPATAEGEPTPPTPAHSPAENEAGHEP
jgi:hypothetical protein